MWLSDHGNIGFFMNMVNKNQTINFPGMSWSDCVYIYTI